jgi:hypothetical protein
MWPSIAGHTVTDPDWELGDFDFRHHAPTLGWLLVAVRGMRIESASAEALVRTRSPSNDADDLGVPATGGQVLPAPVRGFIKQDMPLVEEIRRIVIAEQVMPAKLPSRCRSSQRGERTGNTRSVG